MIISELFHEESYLEIYKHPRVFDKYMEILITITAEFNSVTIYNCHSKPNWIQWPFYLDLGSTKPFCKVFQEHTTLCAKNICKCVLLELVKKLHNIN